MYCRGCGRELPDHAKFCQICGMPVEDRPKSAVSVKNETDTKKPIFFGLFCANVFLALFYFLPIMRVNTSMLTSKSVRELRNAGLDGDLSISGIISAARNIEQGIPAFVTFSAIVAYGLFALQVFFLYRAIKQYYAGIDTCRSRINILKNFRRASIVILPSCISAISSIPMLSRIGNGTSPFEFTFLFWIFTVVSIVCIITASNMIKQERISLSQQ